MYQRKKAELIDDVLGDLNIVGNGQTASPEDYKFAEGRVETIFSELKGRGVINLADLNNIPQEYYEPLVEYIVAKLGPPYGRPKTPVTEFLVIEDRIRTIARQRKVKRTLETDAVLRQGAFPLPRTF